MATFYWVSGNGIWSSTSGTWSLTSGGSITTLDPTASDDVVFDQNSASNDYTVSIDGPVSCRNITIAPISSRELVIDIFFTSLGTINVYGNISSLLVGGGSSVLVSCPIVLRATTTGNTINIPSGGVQTLTLNGVGGEWTLAASSIVSYTGLTSSVTLTNGTLKLASYSLTTDTFASSNSNARTIDFGASGILTIAGSGTTAFNCATSTNLSTVNNTRQAIYLTSATAKTFNGGGATWPGILNSGVGACTIGGSNTFNGLFSSSVAVTYLFTAGSTTTFVGDIDFYINNTTKITINSTVSGSQATLSQVGAGLSVANAVIKDSNATGGQFWVAVSSTDSGNNTGWIFPSGGSMMMFC